MSGGDFMSRAERATCLARGVEDRAQVVRDMMTAQRVNPVHFNAGLPAGCVVKAVADKLQEVRPALLNHLYGDSERGKLRPVFRSGGTIDQQVATVMAAARGERPVATAPAAAPAPVLKIGPMPGSGGKLNGHRVDVPSVPKVVPVKVPVAPMAPLKVVPASAAVDTAQARLLQLIDSWGGKAEAARAIGIKTQRIYNVTCANPQPLSANLVEAILAAPMRPAGVESSAGGACPSPCSAEGVAGSNAAAPDAVPPLPMAEAAAIPVAETPPVGAGLVPPASPPAELETGAVSAFGSQSDDLGRDGEGAAREDAAPSELPKLHAPAPVMADGWSNSSAASPAPAAAPAPVGALGVALNDLWNRKIAAQSEWETATQRALAARKQIDTITRAIEAIEQVDA